MFLPLCQLTACAPRRSRSVAVAVPIRAAEIAAAAPAIAELVTRLAAPLPVPVRGVAMASVLLTDANGPVYSRRGPVVLTVALDAAIAALDPAQPLMPAARQLRRLSPG